MPPRLSENINKLYVAKTIHNYHKVPLNTLVTKSRQSVLYGKENPILCGIQCCSLQR